MTPAVFRDVALRPALRLLPPAMTSIEAEAILLAIALQESRLVYRKQILGPARGYLQFERNGGVMGVLSHPKTYRHAAALCAALDVQANASAVYEALIYQDVLAAGFGRLLLWTVPGRLPTRDEADRAWSQYIAGWRPGKPHPQTWNECWARAWAAVTE